MARHIESAFETAIEAYLKERAGRGSHAKFARVLAKVKDRKPAAPMPGSGPTSRHRLA